MFRFRKPESAEIDQALAAAASLPLRGGHMLSLRNGVQGEYLPFTFSHDYLLTHLGQGRAAFTIARKALRNWVEFELGWVEVVNTGLPIEAGLLVGVIAHTCGLWSLNVSRIVDTIDTETHFGFAYATTHLHVEEGEERFLIEFDPVTKAVTYLLEAVSRPRHGLARLGYPLTRAMQHRFARDSHARMRRAVQETVTLKV